MINQQQPTNTTRKLPACFADRFTNAVKIGKGANGDVYKCLDSSSGEVVALKVVQPNPDNGDLLQAQKEEENVNLMKQIKCEYMIEIFDFLNFFTDEKFSSTVPYYGIVMPYYRYGDLDSFIRNYFTSKGKRLSQVLICHIITQLCIVANAAHHHGLTHCDIKLANIMVKSYDEENETIDIALADFGEAFVSENTLSTEKKGTDEYLPPEAFDRALGTKVDCWGIGVVLFKLLFPDSICSIKLLCGVTENTQKLQQSKKSLDDLWKLRLEEQVIGEIQRHQYSDCSSLLLAVLFGFFVYSRENRLNSLNSLEICSLLLCQLSNATNHQKILHQEENGTSSKLSGSLYLHQLLYSLQFNSFEDNVKLLFGRFKENVDKKNHGISYMIGIILGLTFLNGSVQVWREMNFDQLLIPPDPRMKPLLDSLLSLTQKLKRPNDQYNGHIYEQLVAIHFMKCGNYPMALQSIDNSVKSFYNIKAHIFKLKIMEITNGKTLSLIDEHTTLINRLSDPKSLSQLYAKRGAIKFELAQDSRDMNLGINDLLLARDLSPHSMALYALIVHFYMSSNHIEKAKEVLAQLINRFKDNQQVRNSFLFVTSQLCISIGSPKMALHYSDLLMQNVGPICSLLLFTATIHQHLKDNSMALACIEMALESDPYCEQAHMMKISQLNCVLDFTEAEKAELKYKELQRTKKLSHVEIPMELFPLWPDNSPLEMKLYIKPLVIEEEQYPNEEKELVTSTALDDTLLSTELLPTQTTNTNTTAIQTTEIVQEQPPVEQPPSLLIPTPKGLLLKDVNIKFHGRKGGCVLSVYDTDSDIDQLLDRLNKSGAEANPKYVPRVSFATVDQCGNICFLTSIHQILTSTDTVVALTNEQEQEIMLKK